MSHANAPHSTVSSLKRAAARVWLAGAVLCAVGISAMAVLPALAHAAPTRTKAESAQRSRALQVFKQGKTAYKAGDYGAALTFFRQAQAIYQHEALIILALAKTLDRANEIEKARQYYRLFLKEAPPTDRARAKTVARITAIDDALAKRPATLVLKNLPSTAVLKVNGQTRTPDGKGELSLAPGTYRVSAQLQHHYPFAREGITLKAGERRLLPVVLHRVPDPSTLPRNHKLTWIAGTATGVGVLATGALALQTFFKRNEYFELADENGAPTEKGRKDFGCVAANAGDPSPLECPTWFKAASEVKADYESYRTMTAVSGLVAAGLGVATVVAYFAAPVKWTAAPKTSLWLSPTLDGGLGLTLRF